jgi:D-sedoheptulose 7-phosphate isomerase
MIKLVVFDIDGVLTDGSIIVDQAGNEQKHVNLKDIDAVYSLHQAGYKIAVITGEDTSMVDYFESRFPWDYFYRGCKKKKEAFLEIVSREHIANDEVCYIGDGRYDVDPLLLSGFGVCPADATEPAKVAAELVLGRSGGEGCIWELVELLSRVNSEKPAYRYFYGRAYEHTVVFKQMLADYALMDTMREVGDRIVSLFEDKKRLFFCGNGGSAADAQHLATEFVSRFYLERPGLNAEALTVNTSSLTAIGNDYAFEQVFARQLQAKGSPGDVLVGLSTSGRAKNVHEALRSAKDMDITTVMFTGDHIVPELEQLADRLVKVPSKVTPRVQEAHIFLGHMLAEYVEETLEGGACTITWPILTLYEFSIAVDTAKNIKRVRGYISPCMAEEK